MLDVTSVEIRYSVGVELDPGSDRELSKEIVSFQVLWEGPRAQAWTDTQASDPLRTMLISVPDRLVSGWSQVIINHET